MILFNCPIIHLQHFIYATSGYGYITHLLAGEIMVHISCSGQACQVFREIYMPELSLKYAKKCQISKTTQNG